MKVEILVKPGSRRESVEAQSDGSLRIAVNAPAQEGKANLRVIELLSEYLKLPKSRIAIKRGLNSRKKLIEYG